MIIFLERMVLSSIEVWLMPYRTNYQEKEKEPTWRDKARCFFGGHGPFKYFKNHIEIMPGEDFEGSLLEIDIKCLSCGFMICSKNSCGESIADQVGFSGTLAILQDLLDKEILIRR